MKMSKGQMGRRLLGLAVAGVALVAGGAAFAELGQPAPWEFKLQGSATPVMDNITWFHNLLLVHHHRDHAVRAGAAGHRRREVQRQGQSGSLQDHPQHPDRSGLDPDPGADPGRHRGAVVPAAVSGARHSQGRSDHQGDRQAVVLELRLSRQRQVRIRFADGATKDKQQPRLLGVDNEMVVPVNKVVRVADHRRRRDPFLRGAGVRHQDRRHSRPPQRNLVQGHQDRHVLRPVLGTVRQGSRLHADRGAGGERSGIRGLG